MVIEAGGRKDLELTLRHHFVSPELADRITAALPGVAVDLDERQPDHDGNRYVAVGE